MNNIRYLGVTVVTLLLLGSLSCSSAPQKSKMSLIEPGMTKAQVIELMGAPGDKQFATAPGGTINEALQWKLGWHAGLTSDFANQDMLVVWFLNGRVSGMNTYMSYNGQFQQINWQDAPDFTYERRDR